MIERDGVRYLTASEIRHEPGYGDITPGLLRTWVASEKIRPVTVGELAAALGYHVPADIDPDQPARARGTSGPENVYRWHDVVRVETATRRARVGRHRGRQPRTTRHDPPEPVAA